MCYLLCLKLLIKAISVENALRMHPWTNRERKKNTHSLPKITSNRALLIFRNRPSSGGRACHKDSENVPFSSAPPWKEGSPVVCVCVIKMHPIASIKRRWHHAHKCIENCRSDFFLRIAPLFFRADGLSLKFPFFYSLSEIFHRTCLITTKTNRQLWSGVESDPSGCSSSWRAKYGSGLSGLFFLSQCPFGCDEVFQSGINSYYRKAERLEIDFGFVVYALKTDSEE